MRRPEAGLGEGRAGWGRARGMGGGGVGSCGRGVEGQTRRWGVEGRGYRLGSRMNFLHRMNS